MSYPHLTQDTIETLILFFEFVDADKDGFITINEIKSACEVDIDNDGLVSEAERDACASSWLAVLGEQDLDGDQKLTLHELLMYNNNFVA
jgi:Ca2+-binding EF-hand superfamily protein